MSSSSNDDVRKKSKGKAPKNAAKPNSAVVVVLGGIDLEMPEDTTAGTSTIFHHPQLRRWFSADPMPQPRSHHAAVYYAGTIYVLGGYHPPEVSEGQAQAQHSVFKFDVGEQRWGRAASMIYPRAYHAATVVRRKIMVVGGKDDKGEILNTAESYDPVTNSWMTYRNLPLPIMGCGICFLGGLIYVVGGVTTKKQVMSGVAPAEVLSTVYATDTNERTWVRSLSLPEPRAYCSALSVKHELWVAGGLKYSDHVPDSFTNVADVLAFDPLRCRWEFRFRLPRPRHALGAVNVDDYIYVIGGTSYLQDNSLEDVDVYDMNLLTFVETECLPKKVTGLAAVTVPCVEIKESPRKISTRPKKNAKVSVDVWSNFPESGEPSNACLEKIHKDIWILVQTPTTPGLFIQPEVSDMMKLHVVVVGPPNTPYEGGFFHFLVKFPTAYPAVPPLVRNLTTAGGRISFHSQLPDTGHVLLPILGTGLGSPTWDGSKHGVKDIFECIRSLMTSKALDVSGDEQPSNAWNFDALVHEVTRVAVCDTVEASIKGRHLVPDRIKEKVVQSFLSRAQWHAQTLVAKHPLDGKPFTLPPRDIKGVFQHKRLARRVISLVRDLTQ